MKYLLFITTYLLIAYSWSQMNDSFDDGDFTNNPTWGGDVNDFKINANNQLQLDATGAGSSYLSTPHNLTSIDDTEWSVWVKYSFAPSGSNLGYTYLTATDADLSTNPDGIFFKIGEAGSNDPIELIERSGGVETTILTSTPAIVAASFEVGVKVIYNANGDWELHVDTDGGTNYLLDATANHPATLVGSHVGVHLSYTASNSTRFYYDDFVVDNLQGSVDVDPPLIDGLTVLSNTELNVLFDEPVDPTTAENTANYTVNNGIGSPVSAQLDAINPALVHLAFSTPFTDGQLNTLTITNVEDVHGNAMGSESDDFQWDYIPEPIFIDSFLDGDFTNNPTWGGDVNDFIVNANNQLQLDAAAAGSSYLSAAYQPIVLTEKEWRYNLAYNFAPSVSNRGETYLTATSADLSTNPDGIFFKIGENGSNDPIELFERVGGVETLILTSTPAIVANPFNISVKIIHRANGDWELYTDLDGGDTYLLDVTANYPSSVLGQYLGVKLNYTITNSDRFFYTNFYAGPIILDTIPPSIDAVYATSATEVVVEFNEAIDQATGEDVNNYMIDNGIGNPSSVQQDPNNVLAFVLTLSNTLTIGDTYNITVDAIEDIAGNAMTAQNKPFLYIEGQTAEPGDIIINEFLPRVTPSQGLPEVQFVELYNLSNKYFDLTGWKLSDNNSSGTVQNGWLFPGEYVILVPSTSVSAYPQAIGVTSWANLNLTGDDVKIATDDGVMIDSLTYTDDWYQDNDKKTEGWSIERINPYLPCSSASNWRASEDSNGGTPGAQNSVYDDSPDLTLPTVVAFDIEEPNLIHFTFSKIIDSLSLVNATFTSTPSLTVANRIIGSSYPMELTIEVDQTFTAGQVYEFTLEGFEDCSGNSNDFSGELVLPQAPEVGNLVINEILFRPTTSGAKFVEIYNNSDKYIDLFGVEMANYKDGAIANHKPINVHHILYPHDYVVVTTDSTFILDNYPSSVSGKFIRMSSLPSYNIDSSTVFVIYNNEVMDRVSYTNEWYRDDAKKAGGWSIERINPNLVCTTADNWIGSNDPEKATPGRENSVYDTIPNTQAPTIIDAFTEVPNLLTLKFDKGMDSLSLMNAEFNSTPSLTIANRYITEIYPTKITLEFTEHFVAGEVYNYRFENFADCSGNYNDYEGEFVLPQAPEYGDLIINEILFNPLTGGSDFVEIYNTSDKYIDMIDWELANVKDGEIGNHKTIPYNYVLKPHDYVVITKDSNFQLMNYPVAVPGKFIQIPTLPSYNNDSSTVYLIYQDTVMDKVSYSKDWHFSLLSTQKGVSLERFSAEGESDSPANWHSASETVGFATPGRKNSQDIKPGQEGGTISLSSKTFSPDGDGFEDVLIITYDVSSPDLLGDLRVYDDKGRMIKSFFERQLLGDTGSVKWEGTKEDGTKASIGQYIILFEVFDLDAAKVQTIRKVVTLAGKL